MNAIFAIIKKDFLIELRGKELLFNNFVFSALIIVLFSFVFPPEEMERAYLASGILWVAFAFVGILSLQRSFAYEKDHGNLAGIISSPVPPPYIFLGKMSGSLISMLLVEIFSIPICLVLYQIPFPDKGILLALIIFLGTVGFAIVGSLFSAMTASARARELLLPLLFFPISLPILIASIKATSEIFLSLSVEEIYSWLKILAGFDLIFLTVSPFVFASVVYD